MATTFFTTSTLKKSLFYVVCIFFVSVVAISSSTHAYELGRDVFEVSSGQFTMSGSTNCLNNINNNTVIRNGCTDTADGLTSLGVVLPGGISHALTPPKILVRILNILRAVRKVITAVATKETPPNN